MRPIRCLIFATLHHCPLGELFCHVLFILFNKIVEILIVCQSCFNKMQMLHQIVEANCIQKKVDTFKRHVSCWSNYQLSKCHQIFANVGIHDFYDSTWACRMKGEVSISITFAITYCSNWANLTTNNDDEEHVYECTGCNGDDQSLSGYALLVEWEHALVKLNCWVSWSPLSAIANNLTKERETTQILAQLKSTMLLPLAPLAPHSSSSAYANRSDKHSKIHHERIGFMSTHKKGWKMKNNNAKKVKLWESSLKDLDLLTC